MVVVGTRPEAIKMAPVILALQDSPLGCFVLNTGQHKDMLDSALRVFGITADSHLGLMKKGQTLGELTALGILKMSSVLRSVGPEMVLVHGDTTSAYAAAVAAFYLDTPVGHVEAGLRTHNLQAPFPEEFNRQSIARIASMNFAPTSLAASNLFNEGVSPEKVSIPGNTIVDAVSLVVGKYLTNPKWLYEKQAEIRETYFSSFGSSPYAIVTLHRRENRGAGFSRILSAIRTSAQENPWFHFVFPVHPNPIISEVVKAVLAEFDNVHLTEPLDYLSFMTLLAYSNFSLSDSGGIQEESVTLNKKIFVARDETERPEGMLSGNIVIVGSDESRVRDNLLREISESVPVTAIAVNLDNNPFGGGDASKRIVRELMQLLA